MRELRELTNETVTFQVQQNASMVVIERVESHQAVRSVVQLGATTPLPVTSGGLSLLAWLVKDEQDRILAEPLQQLAPRTSAAPEQIRSRVALVLEAGLCGGRGSAPQRCLCHRNGSYGPDCPRTT